MWKLRAACLAYCMLLTVLLLLPGSAMPPAGWLPEVGVHFSAFTVLGVLVAASRLRLRPLLLAAVLLSYAVGIELLQWFSPLRTVAALDVLENLLGVSAGVALWRFAAWWRISTRRETMPEKTRYRILTPEFLVTYDTFVIAQPQPPNVKPDCLVVLHEASGRPSTVHKSRLIPLDAPGAVPVDQSAVIPCLKCGHVAGVVEDQVKCPERRGADCGLLRPQSQQQA